MRFVDDRLGALGQPGDTIAELVGHRPGRERLDPGAEVGDVACKRLAVGAPLEIGGERREAPIEVGERLKVRSGRGLDAGEACSGPESIGHTSGFGLRNPITNLGDRRFERPQGLDPSSHRVDPITHQRILMRQHRKLVNPQPQTRQLTRDYLTIRPQLELCSQRRNTPLQIRHHTKPRLRRIQPLDKRIRPPRNSTIDTRTNTRLEIRQSLNSRLDSRKPSSHRVDPITHQRILMRQHRKLVNPQPQTRQLTRDYLTIRPQLELCSQRRNTPLQIRHHTKPRLRRIQPLDKRIRPPRNSTIDTRTNTRLEIRQSLNSRLDSRKPSSHRVDPITHQRILMRQHRKLVNPQPQTRQLTRDYLTIRPQLELCSQRRNTPLQIRHHTKPRLRRIQPLDKRIRPPRNSTIDTRTNTRLEIRQSLNSRLDSRKPSSHRVDPITHQRILMRQHRKLVNPQPQTRQLTVQLASESERLGKRLMPARPALRDPQHLIAKLRGRWKLDDPVLELTDPALESSDRISSCCKGGNLCAKCFESLCVHPFLPARSELVDTRTQLVDRRPIRGVLHHPRELVEAGSDLVEGRSINGVIGELGESRVRTRTELCELGRDPVERSVTLPPLLLE